MDGGFSVLADYDSHASAPGCLQQRGKYSHGCLIAGIRGIEVRPLLLAQSAYPRYRDFTA